MNSYIRIVATLFPRDTVCLRNISVDTLHKGDTGDNNNNKDEMQKRGFMCRLRSMSERLILELKRLTKIRRHLAVHHPVYLIPCCQACKFSYSNVMISKF